MNLMHSPLDQAKNNELFCVGIGEWQTSDSQSSELITYSLGSCIGVSVYDCNLKIGGLGHFMLPSSRSNPKRAAQKPSSYVDTGFSALLQSLFDMGASRTDLVIKIAGAARVIECDDRFRIGEKNLAVARKILWKNSLLIQGEDVGGTRPRTMKLFLNDGRTEIKSASELKEI